MTDNWYIVLELDYDPPVEDEGIIKEKIKEKKRFWASQSNHFEMGPKYCLWLEGIPQIEKDMLGPANIRKQLAADACVAIYGEADKWLKYIGQKGYITETEAEKLSSGKEIDLDILKKRSHALGIKWKTGDSIETPASQLNYQAIYEKYYGTEPPGTAVFESKKVMLSTFHADTLYDFLYADTTVQNADKLPCATLLHQVGEKKKEFNKNDSVSATGQKLCNACGESFMDDRTKTIYDNYLSYKKRKAILDDVKTIAEISGELTAAQVEEFVSNLAKIFRDRKLAEDVLEAFCKIEKIVYRSGTVSTNAKIKVCRCGYTNDVSDGRRICGNCGLALTIHCPVCGQENDSNIKICKCGFRLENLDKAIALCEQAEQAIESLKLIDAAAHLRAAEGYWPKSPKVSALCSRLAEYERQAADEFEKLENAVKKRCFMEAGKQYGRIRKRFPGYHDSAVEQKIAKAISDAQMAYRQAQNAKSPEDTLKLCEKAYQLCADYPGLGELKAKCPLVPEPVNITDIRLVNGRIHIYLDAPRDAAGFVVLYRFDRFPADISDSYATRKYIPLKHYEHYGAILLDTEEEKEYYFAVYTEFAHKTEKVYSKGAVYRFDNSPKVNITYSISVAKGLFGSGSVTLVFEADSREFILPEIDVMSSVGNAPIFKSSATLFYRIPSQNVRGSLQVKIPLPKGLAHNTCLRAFFKEETAYAGNQLRLKIHSSEKIT